MITILTDQQNEAIKLYVEGETKTDIAKQVGVSRTTMYNWMSKEEFKSAINNGISEIKSEADVKITAKIPLYIDELSKLALTSKNEKIKSDACQYLIDRVLGKPVRMGDDLLDLSKESGTIEVNKIELALSNMTVNKKKEEKSIIEYD